MWKLTSYCALALGIGYPAIESFAQNAPLSSFGKPKTSVAWSHIEYGAANVTSGNVVADPRAAKEVNDQRFGLLYDRLKRLVEQKGERGVFYVNDLNPFETGKAANLLYLFAQSKGWTQLEVRSLPGDFRMIDLPTTDTAALSNPEGDFFDTANRPKEILLKLAGKTRQGLTFTTSAKAAKNFGFRNEGPGVKYVAPNGNQVPKLTWDYLVPGNAEGVVSASPQLGQPCPIVFREVGAKP